MTHTAPDKSNKNTNPAAWPCSECDRSNAWTAQGNFCLQIPLSRKSSSTNCKSSRSIFCSQESICYRRGKPSRGIFIAVSPTSWLVLPSNMRSTGGSRLIRTRIIRINSEFEALWKSYADLSWVNLPASFEIQEIWAFLLGITFSNWN